MADDPPIPVARRRLFTAVLAVPWAVVFGLVALVVLDARALATLATPTRIERYDVYLNGRDLQEDRAKAGYDAVPHFAPPDPEATVVVWVFGASSVVLPNPGRSFDIPFVDHLRDAGHRPEFHNFGHPGIDSFAMLERVEDAVAIARREGRPPDVVLLYQGHNDFTNGYHHGLLEHASFRRLLTVTWYAEAPRRWLRPDDDTANWYHYRRLRAAGLAHGLQRLGLVHLDTEDFAPFARMTTTAWRANARRATDALLDLGAEVLWVTPVGNLAWEPFGALDDVAVPYARGLRTADPDRRRDLLRDAQEAELFTPDLRAKAVLKDAVRAMSGREHVHVLDLEAALDAEGFAYAEPDFIDYLHWSDEGHVRFTRHLVDAVVRIAPPPGDPDLADGPPAAGDAP